jgi:hypothetical protein
MHIDCMYSRCTDYSDALLHADENSQAIHVLMADVPHAALRGWQRPDYRDAPNRRTTILVGIVLSVLIHAMGLWLLVERMPLNVKVAPAGADERITVSLTPSPPPMPALVPVPAPAQAPVSKPPPPKRSTPKPRKSPAKHPPGKRVEKKAIDRKPDRTPQIVPKTQPETAQPRISPSDDMFTQLEAARKRRAEANARLHEAEPEAAAPAQQDAQNDNSVALANIASSLKHARGRDRRDEGGVFEIRDVGYRSAEVVFWGWSASSRRNSMRLFTIDQGADVDIETAVVKKIIDVIREEKKGDFVWDSHRLGKQITLSARPQDTAELQQFLMREFFPDYLPPAPRR